MGTTNIEWTNETWNPVRGCARMSPGCEHCYAERQAHRQSGVGKAYEGLTRLSPRGPTWTREVRVVEDLIEAPLRWRTPRTIFVNSMSDLFYEGFDDETVIKIFDVMERASWHTFQVLTKRAERLVEIAPKLSWPENVWMGVSVESDAYVERVRLLARTPAKVKWVSAEPLLGPLPSLDMNTIDWLVVGGESGPGAREMNAECVRDLRDRAAVTATPFFFKQWGGVRKKLAGRVLDGRVHDAMPPRR